MMRQYGVSQWPLVVKYGFFRKLYYEPPGLAFAIFGAAEALYWEQRLWPLVFLPIALCFSLFSVKTLSVNKSLKFMVYMRLTLVSWNWFFMGWREREADLPLPKELE
jgi:hypothetical protein